MAYGYTNYSYSGGSGYGHLVPYDGAGGYGYNSGGYVGGSGYGYTSGNYHNAAANYGNGSYEYTETTTYGVSYGYAGYAAA